MRHSGRVLTKSQITDHVWGYDSDAASNAYAYSVALAFSKQYRP